MLKIAEFLTKECICIDLHSDDKKGIINELVKLLVDKKKAKDLTKSVLSILEREKIGTTGVGQGVAMPHGRTETVDKLVGAFGIIRKGVDFDSLDGEPTYLIFLLLSPPDSGGQHLRALAKISRLFKNKFFRQALLDAKNVADVYKILRKEDLY